MNHLKTTTRKWFDKVPKHRMIFNPNSYRMPHPVYSMEDAEKVELTHIEPECFKDKVALASIRFLRSTFDFVTRYNQSQMSYSKWIKRFIFLETVAGIPGMVGGMVRHSASLRKFERDNGWIHNLIEEAENERMHLFTFLRFKQPGLPMRIMILLTQGVFFNAYLLAYLLSPKTCHRFVGYLEEEAVHTYTSCLKQIDLGLLPDWKVMPVAEEARDYWNLPEDAVFRDVIKSIRADEVMHRELNHHFASLASDDKLESHEVEIVTERPGQSPKNSHKDSA